MITLFLGLFQIIFLRFSNFSVERTFSSLPSRSIWFSWPLLSKNRKIKFPSGESAAPKTGSSERAMIEFPVGFLADDSADIFFPSAEAFWLVSAGVGVWGGFLTAD